MSKINSDLSPTVAIVLLETYDPKLQVKVSVIPSVLLYDADFDNKWSGETNSDSFLVLTLNTL